MVNNILKNFLAASILSVALLIVASVIWLFMRDGGTSLQDILFCVGAFPVAIFTIGIFGQYFGRADPTYQLSRSVSERSPNQRAHQDVQDLKSSFKSGLNWLLAGLVLLLICYLI